VGISGTKFTVDGQATYGGRVFEGYEVEGLLFNVRAVQATFDDGNPGTRSLWAYPDTGAWDPERNLSEFCAALESWRDHGVLAFTVNFQGGGAYYAPEVYEGFDNNGFTLDGELKPAYARRIGRVLARADELGMVAIVGIFYCVHAKKMDVDALWRAADSALEFLESTGHRNILIEVANEVEVVLRHTGYAMFAPDRTHEMVLRLRDDHPQFLFSTSQGGMDVTTGRCMPPPSLVDAVDFILAHGNGTRAGQLGAALDAIVEMPAYQACPKPIMINEDSPGMPNFEAAWARGVSWGYFDQGYGGPRAWGGDAYLDYRSKPRESDYSELSGFQTPPVNWTINTQQKRAFFERVAEVTGHAARA
jgi:hypothetical protein